MKILITGCAGFIGSHLTEKLLSLGYIVDGIDNFDDFYSKELKENNLENIIPNPNFRLFEIDILHPELLPVEKYDMVIHLAAKAGVRPSIMNPNTYFKNNVLGTQNILEWMKKNGSQKIILASSSSIYGNNRKVPFAEDDVVDYPISPYAASKKSCELTAHVYHSLYSINVICLRFFTVYGPRQRPDLAINKFHRLISQDKAVPMFGNGDTARDYTYIDDILQGIVSSINYLFSNEKVYEIINLGNKTPIKLLDLIDAIHQIYQKETKIDHLPKQEGDVDITFASIEKARKLLEYFPKTTLKDGLLKFYKWNRNLLDRGV